MNILQNSKDIRILSDKLTITDIINQGLRFNIPIYQRLYVWSNEQIKTLLGDLKRASEQTPDDIYYLGGIMLAENNGIFDLIDGQQRFTTIWLLSKVLKESLSPFNTIQTGNEVKSRISFSVRDFANTFFNLNGEQHSFTEEENKELKPICDAFKIIKDFIKEENVDAQTFSDYIFNHVLFIATKMPPETDENKVFEAMNNRGVQLQQHEILKSRLLSKLKNHPDLMYKYGMLWDACSIMDYYLERNIKNVANLQWRDLFRDSDTEEEKEDIELPDNILERLSKDDKNKTKFKLNDILITPTLNDDEKKLLTGITEESQKEESYDSGKVRSIITFPMLLLHTLRIYQYRILKISDPNESAEVKGKDLIKIFDDYNYFNNTESVICFIDLLWQVRKQFDRFVIKWVSNEEGTEESHLIKRLYQSKTAFQRRAPKANEGFALLQSMLYHSQQLITHYWLTPFLNKMMHTQDIEELYSYLEKLDNAMFCNPRQDLRTMSYKMLSINEANLNGNREFVKKELESHLGTNYPSYWFYKLEFILWKNRQIFNKQSDWEDYKMTAKNSVEHISPQNPKPEDVNIVFDRFNDNEETRKNKQDDFGNLVLLSPGMNTEYSNKTYNVKHIEFKDKRRLDSLKSDLIFENNNWNWQLCEIHRNKMIDLFLGHLSFL